MLDLGPHSAFILGAYAVVVIVLGGLAAWIVTDARRTRAQLKALEAQGVTRRSAARGKSGKA